MVVQMKNCLPKTCEWKKVDWPEVTYKLRVNWKVSKLDGKVSVKSVSQILDVNEARSVVC